MSGRTWRDLEPCGTRAAYQRHKRRGDPPCPACLLANRRDLQARRRGWAAGYWQEEAAYRASVAQWRAEHEQSLRRQQEAAVRTLVALLAEAWREASRAA